jgi:hypothetical protein
MVFNAMNPLRHGDSYHELPVCTAMFIPLIIHLFQLVFSVGTVFFLSKQISQQCFSAGLSAQPNGSYFTEPELKLHEFDLIQTISLL